MASSEAPKEYVGDDSENRSNNKGGNACYKSNEYRLVCNASRAWQCIERAGLSPIPKSKLTGVRTQVGWDKARTTDDYDDDKEAREGDGQYASTSPDGRPRSQQ